MRGGAGVVEWKYSCKVIGASDKKMNRKCIKLMEKKLDCLLDTQFLKGTFVIENLFIRCKENNNISMKFCKR